MGKKRQLRYHKWISKARDIVADYNNNLRDPFMVMWELTQLLFPNGVDETKGIRDDMPR